MRSCLLQRGATLVARRGIAAHLGALAVLVAWRWIAAHRGASQRAKEAASEEEMPSPLRLLSVWCHGEGEASGVAAFLGGEVLAQRRPRLCEDMGGDVGVVAAALGAEVPAERRPRDLCGGTGQEPYSVAAALAREGYHRCPVGSLPPLPGPQTRWGDWVWQGYWQGSHKTHV